MRKLAVLFSITVAIAYLTGCATVKDVQRATDLIRTDNELTRLLIEVRPTDPAGASTYLSALADHARDEADSLQNSRDTVPDAIAYYRIAATAYWRSGRQDIADSLFKVTDNGTRLCTALGNNAPDRDCMFLQLVIPFAGLEAINRSSNIDGMLSEVSFSDGVASGKDIEDMTKIYSSMLQVRPLVEKIIAVSTDNRYFSHSGMRKYYCENVSKAVTYYEGKLGLFRSKVNILSSKIPEHRKDLDLRDEQIDGLALSNGVPGFCSE